MTQHLSKRDALYEQLQARLGAIAERRELTPEGKRALGQTYVAEYKNAIGDLRSEAAGELSEARAGLQPKLAKARGDVLKRRRELYLGVPSSLVAVLERTIAAKRPVDLARFSMKQGPTHPPAKFWPTF